MLLAICWLAASRAGVIVSSIVWVLIGFQLYREFSGSDDSLLILGIVYMIAVTQVFMPLNPKVKGRDKMVQFRQGMLGVAVVVVAIAGALLGSWAMSMDVEERTVTTYDALTDITPLFDSEMAPAYTDYNPATNYTGYYTESTTIGDHRYFGGVDYKTADRPNNYKLDMPPIEAHSGTATLSNDSTAYNRQVWLNWWSPLIENSHGYHGTYSWSDSIKSHHLTDVIAGITSQTTGKITLKSGEGPNLTDRSSSALEDMDWVIFGNINVYRGDHNYYFATQEAIDNWLGTYPSYSQTLSLSCVADMDRNIATLYYDNECTIRVCDLTLDQVIVFCRGGDSALGDPRWMSLSSTCEYDFAAFPEPTYMNPSRGVEIEQ